MVWEGNRVLGKNRDGHFLCDIFRLGFRGETRWEQFGLRFLIPLPVVMDRIGLDSS